MPTPNDLVYDAIYKGSLNAGALQSCAQHYAAAGLERYKEGIYSTPTKLIDEMIKSAKRDSKK